VAKVGWAQGTCGVCGRTYRARRPVQVVVCDCYRLCPLCSPAYTVEMTPYTPDLTQPRLYRSEEGGATMRTLYACYRHTPPYYSAQKPVEVVLS